MRRRRRNQRGQAAVEAVLAALLLILTVIGIFDMAQLWFVCQTLTERARNGARYAAVNSFDADAIRNLVVYNRTDAPDGSPPGIFGLEVGMVNATREGADTESDRIVVSITGYPYRLFTPLLAGTLPNVRPIMVSIPYEAGGG